MRNDLTDITIILDRSGSMEKVRTDAEGGLNKFIKEQAEGQSGDALLTLVQFDDKYEMVVDHKPVKEAALIQYPLVPRGWTNLYGALGRTIETKGERFKAMPEDQRPGVVIIAIITDGHHNTADEKFSQEMVRKMIQHQEEVYKWTFLYLGANVDAFEEGAAIGITRGRAAGYAEEKTAGGLGLVSRKVATMRRLSTSGASPEEVQKAADYTDQERKEITSQS